MGYYHRTLIAKFSFDGNNKIVSLRMANVNENRVTLNKEQIIGTCEPIARVARIEVNVQIQFQQPIDIRSPDGKF